MGLLQNEQSDSLLEDFTEEQVTKTNPEETAQEFIGKSINSKPNFNRNPRNINRDRFLICMLLRFELNNFSAAQSLPRPRKYLVLEIK